MAFLQPNKAVPGGCVLGFLGLFPIVFGGILGWGWWKGFQLPADERSEKWLSHMWQLGGGSLLCLVLGLLLIFFGLRLSMNGADMTKPYSVSKPKMRF